MGICPYCEAEVIVQAELIGPEESEDDNVPMADDGTIQLEQGARMFQYVCPECDTILGAGTHKWAR